MAEVKRIKVIGFEEALRVAEVRPWYAERVGEVFTVDRECDNSYFPSEFRGSIMKEDAEVVNE